MYVQDFNKDSLCPEENPSEVRSHSFCLWIFPWVQVSLQNAQNTMIAAVVLFVGWSMKVTQTSSSENGGVASLVVFHMEYIVPGPGSDS